MIDLWKKQSLININENKHCSIGNNARGDEYIYEQTLIIEHVYVLGEYHK